MYTDWRALANQAVSFQHFRRQPVSRLGGFFLYLAISASVSLLFHVFDSGSVKQIYSMALFMLATVNESFLLGSNAFLSHEL